MRPSIWLANVQADDESLVVVAALTKACATTAPRLKSITNVSDTYSYPFTVTW